MNILETSAIISLSVFFIHASAWTGMINEWIREIINPEKFWSNPVYNCPICMTPWWGAVFLAIMHYTDITNLSFLEYAITLFCASGISTVLALINMIEDKL